MWTNCDLNDELQACEPYWVDFILHGNRNACLKFLKLLMWMTQHCVDTLTSLSPLVFSFSSTSADVTVLLWQGVVIVFHSFYVICIGEKSVNWWLGFTGYGISYWLCNCFINPIVHHCSVQFIVWRGILVWYQVLNMKPYQSIRILLNYLMSSWLNIVKF